MHPENEYVQAAQSTLRALIDALDALPGDGFEAELANDIITIEFTDGTKYIVNSHRAARQIWMAAERTAWHFDFDAPSNRWRAAKTGDELFATVERVLGSKLGRTLHLAAG